jgi:hypothetical protein
LPDLQHLCHHLRRNLASDEAHLGVERLLHIVGIEGGARIDLVPTRQVSPHAINHRD